MNRSLVLTAILAAALIILASSSLFIVNQAEQALVLRFGAHRATDPDRSLAERWLCRAMGVADPGAIVWDEVVAFWLVLWLVTPATFWGQLGAFALFRYFDAAKPGPVRWADSLFKGFGWRGGWGIIFDDLVAAFCTLLVIAIWRSL